MRINPVLSASILSALSLIACSGGDSGIPNLGGTGGTSGGAAGTAGTAGSSGSSAGSAGSISGSAGDAGSANGGSGGSSGTGGSGAVGGTGGSGANAGTGGVSGSGGNAGTGATGGSAGSGGNAGNAGSAGSGAVGGSGGTAGTSGSSGTGGSGGTTVECNVPADCAGMDTSCSFRTCLSGVCGMDFVPNGTNGLVQTGGDCLITVCDGAGVGSDIADDTDVPMSPNACTIATCAMGMPVFAPAMQGISCGPSLVCDADGNCVGCNTPNDCQGVDDECQARTCIMGMCGVALTPQGTPAGTQQANDCQKSECDGNGTIATVADTTDVPLDDGNPCTNEVCNGSQPEHTSVGDGTPCSDGNACTMADTCQAGTCTAGMPVVCTAVDQCHDTGICDTATGMCSTPAKMDGSTCSDGNACTQTDTCQAGTCIGANAVACNMPPDSCHTNVGMCDTTTGGCTYAPLADGSACSLQGNPGTCSGGVCGFSNPYTLCVNPNQAITGAGPGINNPSIINIPISGTVTDVNVSIIANHTWPGDLQFRLFHSGTSVYLIDKPGAPASTYGCATDNINVTLDDEGASPVESVCNAAPPGISSPPNRTPNAPLSSFDGMQMLGNWNLVIDDTYAQGDDGSLAQWCITISY